MVAAVGHLGRTPLHEAAALGRVNKCREVMRGREGVAAPPDFNAQDLHGCTALHLAAEAGHAEVCRLLLDALVEANAQDKEGCTALHLAAMNGLGHVCTLLAEHPNGVSRSARNRFGQLALEVARGEAKNVLQQGSKLSPVGAASATE